MSRVARRLQRTSYGDYPSYSDYPVIDYPTLWAQVMAGLPIGQRTPMTGAGSNVGQVLAGMTSRAYVTLPDGFVGELVDFTYASNVYACYAPNCMGIWGPSSDPSRAIIRMKAMSSTQASQVPDQSQSSSGATNPLYLMRLGPSSGSTVAACHCYGWTLIGTDQPNGPNGQPHNYNGLVDYKGTGSTYQHMKFIGIPGDWSSPPGETFAFASFFTNGGIYEYLESDGFNEAGEQVGGGIGNHAASHPTYRNCNFHDSYVSGLTFGGSMGPSGVMCDTVQTTNVKVLHNANHVVPNTGGKTFRGLNHEGAYISVHHDSPEIMLDNQQTFQNGHVYIGNTQVDCPDFVITEPNWHPELGPTQANGAFIVHIPATYAGVSNTQTTWPTVIKNGVTLSPVIRATGAGWPSGVNPATQYILMR